MKKLTLIKTPDQNSNWIAEFDGEEAHNIKGSNNRERLENAANIWGLDLDEVETEIHDDRIDAYSLRDFIEVFYGGNNSEFARANGITRQQVNEWIGKDFIVMNETLFSPRRLLETPPA